MSINSGAEIRKLLLIPAKLLNPFIICACQEGTHATLHYKTYKIIVGLCCTHHVRLHVCTRHEGIHAAVLILYKQGVARQQVKGAHADLRPPAPRILNSKPGALKHWHFNSDEETGCSLPAGHRGKLTCSHYQGFS
eukprot:1139547-Pelagomonas_calceolata.AAC.15